MMTLRQFLSIVLSCFVFQHSLSLLQWVGTAVVFGGLFLRSIEKQRRPTMSLTPRLKGERSTGQTNDTLVPLLKKASSVPDIVVAKLGDSISTIKIKEVEMPDGPKATSTLAHSPVQRTHSSKLQSGGSYSHCSPITGLEMKDKPV
jgi:hypothetical protein